MPAKSHAVGFRATEQEALNFAASQFATWEIKYGPVEVRAGSFTNWKPKSVIQFLVRLAASETPAGEDRQANVNTCWMVVVGEP